MLRKATSLPLLWLIRAYQVTFSGLFPNTCRYQPTCSQYMYGAVDRYGPLRGTWLGVRRIGRCRPGGGNGYDPVPERRE
ncbi:MAG: membrane protein insertion efficiency factor YidD [Dehalococcoidia bacterium]